MKREKTRAFLVSAAVSLMVALGGAGCLVTGFGLELDRGIWVTASIVLTSLLCAAWFPRRRGGLGVLCVAAVAVGYLWHEGTAWEQIRQLIYRISHVYDGAYGWGVLQLTEGSREAESADLPVAILGCAAAMGTCWAMCRRKHSAWGLVPGLMMLGLCMVVTDTVPAASDLFLLLGGVTMLLLTGSVRKESASQGSRLVLRAAIPAAVFLTILSLTLPKDSYVNQSQKVRENLVRLAGDFQGRIQRTVEGFTEPGIAEKVELSSLGPQRSQMLPVLEISGDGSGTVYLRGQDYDRYTGTDWESSQDREESFAGSGEEIGQISVRTLTGSYGILYFPYYPGAAVTLTGGKCVNGEHARVYSVTRREDAAPETLESENNYLTLPSSTVSLMAPLLGELYLDGLSDQEKAGVIAAYVEGSARYDRNTARMPEGELDFASWFLKKSETGYCVHFATAAAVLLRAAGVPARYVTGYLAQCRGADWSTVTADQAHAWVEYYDRAAGCWTLLDATPADLTREETEPTEEITLPPRETEETRQEAPGTATQASAFPTGTAAPEEPAETYQISEWLIPLGKWVLAVLLAAAVLTLQRTVRIYARQRRESTGTTNRRALALWQEAEGLAKLLKETPPEQLRVLAQKAKFSQHTLEDGELAPFADYLRKCRNRLGKAPWYIRVYYRWILAVY